jgi:hypothetical protein
MYLALEKKKVLDKQKSKVICVFSLLTILPLVILAAFYTLNAARSTLFPDNRPVLSLPKDN